MTKTNILLLLAAVSALGAEHSDWPQFRGLNGSGVAGNQKPPIHFGPSSNLLWKVPLPAGASSPCIWGDRIFVTGLDEQKLETLCLRRSDGQTLWRRTAPAEKLETFHKQEGSPAASTPVTDGQRVYVYFGSYGALAYDFEGVEQWRRPLPMIETFGGFGTGTSPILADGLILLNRDQAKDSHVMALRAATGEVAWRTARGLSYSWCTPAIWTNSGVKEVVLPGSTVVKGYDLQTGAERWVIRGIAAATCSTPVVGDSLLYVCSWSTRDGTSPPPSFDAMLEKDDKNKDGALSLEEASNPEFKAMFSSFDVNRDTVVTRDEHEPLRAVVLRSRNVLLAVRPGGRGDITDSHVAWSASKGLPYVPSPLLYRGRLHLVKDGGLASCFDATTGGELYAQERLGAEGSYYASPVAADDRIYVASARGVLVVLKAAAALEVLARNNLGERIFATPAVVDDALYVRTAGHLYAFGNPPSRNVGVGPR